MADKTVTVKDIVRSLTKGVITPRYAVTQLEKIVSASYVNGYAEGLKPDGPKINEENL